MKTDLKNTNGVINEIEEILEGVKLGHIQHDEAKIRMWGVKNVIRLMAIEVLRERFIDGTAKEGERVYFFEPLDEEMTITELQELMDEHEKFVLETIKKMKKEKI